MVITVQISQHQFIQYFIFNSSEFELAVVMCCIHRAFKCTTQNQHQIKKYFLHYICEYDGFHKKTQLQMCMMMIGLYFSLH